MNTSATLLDSLKRSPRNDAWAQLNELYRPMIMRWLRYAATGRSVDVSDLEDVTQEVLQRVAEKIEGFQHGNQPGGFRRWLKLIALNCFRNYSRKVNRGPKAVGGTEFAEFARQLEANDSPLSKKWEAEHQQSVLRYLLEKIQPEFQPKTWKIFIETAIEQRAPGEVADKNGISVASVYTAKSRVLARLRQLGQGVLEMD